MKLLARLALVGWVVGMVTVSTLVFVGCENDNHDRALSISPISVSYDISSGTNISFSASGGTAPYTWTVQRSDLGSIVGAGNQAIYSPSAVNGVNVIIVTDDDDVSVAATVTQS